MATWHMLDLGDAMLAGERLAEIEERLRAEHARATGRAAMAAFYRHRGEGRLHCAVVVYFSPDAAELARRWRARACPPPSPDGLSLLAGGEEAWTLLSGQGREAAHRRR